MKSIVCTLSENHYHFGVACLINSLCKQGYQGSIYVGYRGTLPEWTNNHQKMGPLSWPGAITMTVTTNIAVHLLPLDTNYHFTNYKPDFMLRLWQMSHDTIQNIFYFDPDIIVTAPWTAYEEWVTCGVALCEDVNSPLPKYHPRRVAWRRYFGSNNFTLQFKEAIYANGGFIGVSVKDVAFLTCWKKIQEIMAPAIGGLERSSLAGAALHEQAQGIFAPFSKTDQDALNATIEAWDGEVSFLGKEGMAFKYGAPLMSHALGHPKPWQLNPLIQAWHGIPPRQVDRDYWKAADGPIVAHSASFTRRQLLAMQVARVIGRFYRKVGI